MGYQSRAGSPRNTGRGRGVQRREKAKARGHKRRSSGSYLSEENRVLTAEEVTDRTLNSLRSLGNQRFALAPFNEHFGRWLTDLRVVLSEFESIPTVNVDDQFVKERSQILSNVEAELEELRRKEASGDEAFKNLSDNNALLERIEKEYVARTKEIKARKDGEIKRLSSNVDGLKQELDRISQTKAGIFRRISKKAKAQKEAEATQRLNTAQSELTSAMQRFTVEQEKLREEHEKRKKPIIEQMQYQQKEVQGQEIDTSIEARRLSCDALISSVNALLQRKTVSSD